MAPTHHRIEMIRRLLQRIRYGKRYASRRFARSYDLGKRFEDYQANLVSTLEGIAGIDGAVVADIGTGTGQVARRVADRAACVRGFDVAPAMIRFAGEACRRQSRLRPITFDVADAVELPVEDASVDIAIYPWSLTSILAPGWPFGWRGLLNAALSEADRIVRAGGTIAVIETANVLGELPWGHIWHPMRREFLSTLESELGFRKVLFANDWDFETVRNLRRFAGLWFAPDTIRSLTRSGKTVLEECAGIWWRSAPTLRARRARVAAIIIRDGKIALIKREHSTRGRLYYVFPGGGLEPGERCEDAVVREVLEETGLRVTVERLVIIVNRLGSEQHHYLVSITGGEFGAGTGPEFGGNYGSGTYEAVWIDVPELLDYPVLPRRVSELVLASAENGWPREPVRCTDDDQP